MHSSHLLCSYSYICWEINSYYLRNRVTSCSKAGDLTFSCKTSKLSRMRLCAFEAQPGRSRAKVKTVNQFFPVTNKGLKFLVGRSTVCTITIFHQSPWKTQQETGSICIALCISGGKLGTSLARQLLSRKKNITSN